MLPAHRHRHFHFVLWFAIFLLGCNSHRPVLVLVLVVFSKSPKNGIDRPASNRRSFVCHSRDRIVMEARKAKRNGKTRQYKTEGKKFFGFLLKERKKKKKKKPTCCWLRHLMYATMCCFIVMAMCLRGGNSGMPVRPVCVRLCDGAHGMC